MKQINLESNFNSDIFTEYVCDQYDIQNRNSVKTTIPMIDINELEKKFNILLILGNSGSGKSTILKNLGYSEEYENTKFSIDYTKPLISQFPNKTPQEVCDIFYGIGLASVPTWLKKPHQISNGESARFNIACKIANAQDGETIFIDEFTSVVNRPCALSMSHALQRYIRQHNLKVIIASCHYDIIEWLQPDYIFDLNQQENGECEIQKMIYSDNEEYKSYKMVNENDILSDGKDIN